MSKNHPNQQNNRTMLVQQTSVQSFSGPLPPPEVLKRFDEIVPGAAERIIKMAEAQSEHRKDLEKKVIESDISRSKWGQILGFIISITGLIVSGFISIYGNAIVGGIVSVSMLASLVGVFMYGSKTRAKEREEKSKE